MENTHANCTITKEWKDHVDLELKDLRENAIRTDERQKGFAEQLRLVGDDTRYIKGKVEEMSKAMAVNDYKTEKNTKFLDAISIGKILTIAISILTIIAFIKS